MEMGSVPSLSLMNQTGPPRVIHTYPSTQIAFVRHVYGVLTAQLAWTVLLAVLCAYWTPFRDFCLHRLERKQLYVACVVLILLLVIPHPPTKMVLLFVWTTLMGTIVGVFTSTLPASDVLEAATVTLVMFLSLSAHAHSSQGEYSVWGGLLWSCLWGSCIAALLFAFNHMRDRRAPRMHLPLAFMNGLLFCAFIVYDTRNMLHRYTYDQWMECAVELYLDILNLFLEVLELLGEILEEKK